MKTTFALIFTIGLAGGSIRAEKLANGLEFRTPQGWTVKTNGQAAAIQPPDLVMEPGGKDPSEVYLLGMQESVSDVSDPQSVAVLLKEYFPAESRMRIAGAPQAFQAAGGSGYRYTYDAVSEGIAVRVQIYVVALAKGGVAGLVAVARPALLSRREATLVTLAASLAHTVPAAVISTQRAAAPAGSSGGPEVAQWEQRLRGRKLYQFSSYSSGYGSGGYNSQKTLFLGTNGIYEFRRSGSVSVYVDGASGGSASQGANQGRWRIYEQGGKILLELASAQGGIEKIELTSNGTQTLLNGNRWLVGD